MQANDETAAVADKFEWNETEANTKQDMEAAILGYILSELDNRCRYPVTGPDGETYRMFVTVELVKAEPEN